MGCKTGDHGIAGVDRKQLVVTLLFAEMKVWSDGVLQQMDQAITRQNQCRGPAEGETKALRNHLQQRSREHEACTERNEVSEIAFFPTGANQDHSTQNIG